MAEIPEHPARGVYHWLSGLPAAGLHPSATITYERIDVSGSFATIGRPQLRRILSALRSNDAPQSGATRIIVGLGNPGSKYQHTRHNVGFKVIDELARRLPEGRERTRFDARFAETKDEDVRVVLVKPMTMMNDSGRAISQFKRWYKVENRDILVVHDDLDLAFGRVQLRPGGGAGGHNGVASTIRALGGEDFPRVRVGIGRPVSGSTVSYVLSHFRREEQAELPAIIDYAAEAALSWLRDGLDTAMNTYNRRESESRLSSTEQQRAGKGERA